MQKIEGKLYTPFQKKHKKVSVDRKDGSWNFTFEDELKWERLDATVNRVRASEGYMVSSFRELIDEVAIVTINNKNFEMFYRGQLDDYKNNTAEYFKDRVAKSTIYPTICRPEKNSDGKTKYSIKKNQIIERYDRLEQMIKLVEGKKRRYFKEYYYALFQHYDILPTPLIDITQSLRVAATFALRNSSSGYLYVFGLPYPNQSISYYSDLGIVLIKLQNVLQTDSLRPRYQEGFLVGKYPIVPTKTQGDDLANRMVAKFKLDNTDGKFWDKHFPPMPEEVLYPKNDSIELELLKAKREFDKLV
ncbi:FRG domain-containing protein [Pedobacter psychrodurus]|uniref:FRG domain-containing protein n=1 Tax=Pedobacter psychrodurus TaxID=2530456 RepID=A0A4R0PP55_9SPHI|nr:FRG domain-containing protein [Pedobacter psychrodurus]TCD17461.1 FRG domain-containing protein [Pedobacter psychrodurus]